MTIHPKGCKINHVNNKMNIIDYETIGGKNIIKTYLDCLSAREKVVGYIIRDKIYSDGIIAFEGFNTRQIRKKLWEIKFLQHRIMYVIKDQSQVYFVHACKKQKGKAEKFEIDKAVARVKELEKETGCTFV